MGRFIGFAAVYALLLNLILTGLLGAQHATAAPHVGGIFELCLSSADGSPSHPADSSEHAGKVHCVLCAAGGALASAPVPSTIAFVVFQTLHVVLKPDVTGIVLSSVDHRSTSPRGPPQQA
jgi:hypothetical protein